MVGGSTSVRRASDAGDRLDCPGAAKDVAGHRLGRRDRDRLASAPIAMLIAAVSVASLASVDVPCALMYPMSVWMRPASSRAASSPGRRRCPPGGAG